MFVYTKLADKLNTPNRCQCSQQDTFLVIKLLESGSECLEQKVWLDKRIPAHMHCHSVGCTNERLRKYHTRSMRSVGTVYTVFLSLLKNYSLER